ADLLGRSQALDERIGRLAGRPRLAADDEKRLDDLRGEASELRRQLLDFQQGLGLKYGALAGKPVALDEARAARPEGAAPPGWGGARRWATRPASSAARVTRPGP